MDVLSIVSESLRYTDTLYYLLQQNQNDHDKVNQNCTSADELRDKLSDVERRLYVHRYTSGKTLQESVSAELFFTIANNLNAIKVYLYSVVNMSSPYFREGNTTTGTLHTQINAIRNIVDIVKEKINSF